MTYIKPSWFFVKILNRIALATGAASSQPLTVVKRGSKLSQTIPMTPVVVDGVTYLVSVRGTDYVATDVPVRADHPVFALTPA